MSRTFRIKMKELKRTELKELEVWLEKFNLPRTTRKIYRDFSDGTLFVKILHHFYSKFVDFNNYPTRSSVALKLSNWETLNRKILRKIDLTQNKKILENISNSMPGYIERLLYQFMKLEKQKLATMQNINHEHELNQIEDNLEVMMVNVNKNIGNAIVQMPQKMILYSTYEQLNSELIDKNKLLDKNKQRIQHLESLMILKDQRIDDLLRTIAQQSIRKFVVECGNIATVNSNSNSNNINNSSPCLLY